MSLERLLQIAERLVGRKALDRIDTALLSTCTASIRHERAADAVDMHRARAAHAMLAADVRAGRAEFMPDEIRQQFARLAMAARVRGR